MHHLCAGGGTRHSQALGGDLGSGFVVKEPHHTVEAKILERNTGAQTEAGTLQGAHLDENIQLASTFPRARGKKDRQNSPQSVGWFQTGPSDSHSTALSADAAVPAPDPSPTLFPSPLLGPSQAVRTRQTHLTPQKKKTSHPSVFRNAGAAAASSFPRHVSTSQAFPISAVRRLFLKEDLREERPLQAGNVFG